MYPARWATRFASVAAAYAGLTATGCAGDDTSPALPPTADAAVPVAQDATTGDANARPVDAAPPPLPIALVRVANWSPDAPGVDVCLAPHGTTAYEGPLLGHATALLDAGATLLGYPSVSAYLSVAPGTYDVRAVVAGATDCAANVGPDLTSLAPLAIGSFTTLALLGSVQGSGGAPKLQLAAFVDEGISSGKLALRFINAAGSVGTADFGTGSGATFKSIFKSVAFGAAGAIPDAGGADAALTADSHGYALVSPLSSATVSAHATGATTDAVVVHGVTVAAGAVVTAVLLQGGKASPDGGASFGLLECVDNAGTVGVAGSCAMLSP